VDLKLYVIIKMGNCWKTQVEEKEKNGIHITAKQNGTVADLKTVATVTLFN
jgi:hypothetical protein